MTQRERQEGGRGRERRKQREILCVYCWFSPQMAAATTRQPGLAQVKPEARNTILASHVGSMKSTGSPGGEQTAEPKLK